MGLAGPGLRREPALADQPQYFGGGLGDFGAGAVDRGDPGLFQEIVVLRGDDAAADDENVAGAFGLERRDQRRHQRLVAGGLARYADDVHVVFDRLAGGLLGGLKQRADIDVEADIGEGGGDDLGAAV